MSPFTKKKVVRWIVIVAILSAVCFVYARREDIGQLPIGCGFKASILCAGVFVSGRDPKTVEAEDIGFHPLFKLIKAKIDRGEKSVTTSLFGIGLFKRKAVVVEGLGAVLLSGVPEDAVRAWKIEIPVPEPAHPQTVNWPMGDFLPDAPIPAEIDKARLDDAVAGLFRERDPKRLIRTRAVLVVHDGRIVAERYASGYGPHTRLNGWSMAKSVGNALIGILARQGKLDIRKPAPVPEWGAFADPRRAVTVDELLRMSSGLEWFEAYADHPASDVNRMLFTVPDMAAFAAGKPLAAERGTRWEYSSGTANLLSRIVKDVFGSREEYWAFPRRELFNKIGMRSAVFECDASGTFVASSLLYATARDFARFGLLYLNDGVWQGERILPEGWVAYTTTPTPPAPRGQYGALFWLNAGEAADPGKRPFPRLPRDMFMCEGYQGQMVAVIPSAKLVVVRLGMTYDDIWGTGPFLESVLAALGPETAARK
jgi:CubicO group peptidase (beta-lactamase class C family)